MHEVRFAARPPIDGYGAGAFRIAGFLHRGPVMILPSRVAPWSPAEPLTADCFADALAAVAEIDLLLVGMGADIRPLPCAAALEAAGLAVEPMGTAAACRTFNVLLAEERRVAAALLPV